MNRTTYGVDIAKSVMQLHWVDGETGEIGRKQLTRAKLSAYFAQLQPLCIVMEVCGGAHYWARKFQALGHEVGLLPARQARPFVRGNKDDAADARAIRRAPIKSVEQQAVQSLHRLRQHWVSVRTATLNALRSLMYEFGVVLPGGRQVGVKAIGERHTQIDAQLPALMQRALDTQLAALKDVERQITQLESEIVAQQKQSTPAQKLTQMPGIGRLGSTALAATLGDGKAWRNAREFTASLGPAPVHRDTSGKTRMGHISKRGNPYRRTLLIDGARAVIANAKQKPEWLSKLLQRRPANVAAVALANKMALVAKGAQYSGITARPTEAAPHQRQRHDINLLR